MSKITEKVQVLQKSKSNPATATKQPSRKVAKNASIKAMLKAILASATSPSCSSSAPLREDLENKVVVIEAKKSKSKLYFKRVWKCYYSIE